VKPKIVSLDYEPGFLMTGANAREICAAMIQPRDQLLSYYLMIHDTALSLFDAGNLILGSAGY